MRRSVFTILAVVFVTTGFSSVASAAPVGLLTFDLNTLTGNSFNITNLTGLNAFFPDFPIETPLTIGVTGLTATTTGGTLALGGNAFTADAAGNVNCTVAGDAATGGCNFGAYEILTATLIGSLSPTTGLTGLPAGYTGIASTFTATITPGCDTYLTAGCDVAFIDATLVADPAAVPEPSTLVLLGTGVVASWRARRSLKSRRERA